MAASFNEILEAYQLASMANSGYGRADVFLCRQSGRIYWRYDEFSGLQKYNDDVPADIDDEEKYIQLPDKRELDLGVALVMEFARQLFPPDVEDTGDHSRQLGAH